MHSHEFIQHCQYHSVGTTVYTTHPRDVERFHVPKNPTSKQTLASKILSEISALENSLISTTSCLEQTIQALFRSWFIDFDPVKAKAEGRLPSGMDEETALFLIHLKHQNMEKFSPAGIMCSAGFSHFDEEHDQPKAEASGEVLPLFYSCI